MQPDMVRRYRSETGKYVYFINPVWTSLVGSNDTNFDKEGGIVFDEIVEKAERDYNELTDDEKMS
jgi:peptide deformylase